MVLGNENVYFLFFSFGIRSRLSNYSQIVWSELGFSPSGHSSQVPSSAISLDWQALQLRRSSFGISPAFGQSWQLPSMVIWCDGQAKQASLPEPGISPGFGQSSHWPSLVIWFNGQAWQPRRSIFGTSPVFVQSWHLPLLMNWCNGQALQLRASSFGTSPFGQFSQLPLFVIWLAGHSSEKTITELV